MEPFNNEDLKGGVDKHKPGLNLLTLIRLISKLLLKLWKKPKHLSKQDLQHKLRDIQKRGNQKHGKITHEDD